MVCFRGIYYVLAVLLSVTHHLVSAEEPCTRSPDTAISALKKKLFCNYDPSLVPVNDTTSNVEVEHLLMPEYFDFYEHDNLIEIHGDVIMEWNDHLLTWNESNYDDLEDFVVETKELWMPDIYLSTPVDMRSIRGSYQSRTTCVVSSNGKVECMVPLVYEAHCNPDITRWPFDSHTCNMRVSTQTSQVVFSEDIMKIEMVQFPTDNYWKLVDTSCYNMDTLIGNMKFPTIVYSFVFERHSGFIVATFFVPSIVMMTATICAFCFHPHGVARLLLIGGNVISHCSFLMYLSWYLPPNGSKTPIVVTFFRDSFILVGVSIMVTICSARMAAASRAPPTWLSAIADAIEASPAQCLLFNSLHAKSNGLDGCDSNHVAVIMASSASNKWRRLAILLDRTCLFIFAALLGVLSSAYLP